MGKPGESAASCRIERKRAHDREAQRASRAKTKAYIAHLEKTVADLSSNSGDNRANYLSQHASKQAEEIESLQGLVNKIRSLVHDNTKAIAGHSAPALPASGNGNDANSPESADSSEHYYLDNSPPNEDPWRSRPSIPMAPPNTSPRNLVILGENLLCDESEEATYFASLSRALSKLEQVPDNLSTIDEDHDILIRAMLHGWDESERMHHFDIVWRFIRAFDEGLWWRAGRVERITMFWQIRMFLLHRINPKNQPKREIQPFMVPTARQRGALHHHIIADYFPWPLVRDHLVDEGFQHATGRNVILFAKSFRFSWPYELRDTYMKNSATGQYRLSDSLLKSHNNLSNYGVLQNGLFPSVYRHPSIVRQSSGSKEDVAAEQAAGQHLHPTRASCLPAEVTRHAASAAEDDTSPSSLVMDDPGTIDWPHPFDLDMTNDPKFMPFAPDPFSMVHEASLLQWPVL